MFVNMIQEMARARRIKGPHSSHSHGEFGVVATTHMSAISKITKKQQQQQRSSPFHWFFAIADR
jgi:hypothetical protein